MSTAEEAFMARREAVQLLEKLLHSPDDLRKLDALLAEYKEERRLAGRRLGAALSSRVRDIRAGLEGLARAEETLASFESCFADIKRLCDESASLVDAGPEIRELGAVHANMRQTIKNAELVAALPAQASEAERLLQGGLQGGQGTNSSLLRAYTAAAELEATVAKVQRTLESFNAAQQQHMASGSATANRGGGNESSSSVPTVPSLEFYFAQVRRAMTAVEERLWGIIRGFRSVARSRPAVLVAALQVVEVQERVDRELLAAGQGGSPLRKGWRNRCMLQLRASLQESFAPVLQRCSKLLAEDAAVADILESSLTDAHDVLLELLNARDAVHACFPPHYAVLTTLCDEARAQVGSLLDLVGLSAGRLSNKDILGVLQWVEDAQTALRELLTPSGGKQPTLADRDAAAIVFLPRVGGGGRQSSQIDGPGTEGVALMLQTYVSRVSSTLNSWLANLVEADFRAEPARDVDGRLWTPAPVDLFRMLDEQLAVAAPAGGALVHRIAGETARVLFAFQEAYREKLSVAGTQAHPLEVLCAVANNAYRSKQLSEEFARRAGAMASAGASPGNNETSDATALMSRLSLDANAVNTTTAASKTTQLSLPELEAACDGFDAVLDAALEAAADSVFSDPGFVDLFARVACTSDWLAGDVTGSVLATLDDYMCDFDAWLFAPVTGRLAARLTSETSSHYIAAVLMQLKTVEDDDVRALRRDVEQLNSFFVRMVDEAVARAETQPLVDLADFVTSDSVEAFELSYSALLGSAPGISPVLLSNVLAARVVSDPEMTKADSKEVLEACRQVFKARAAEVQDDRDRGGGKGASRLLGSGGGGRDAAFVAALNAARRRGGHGHARREEDQGSGE